VDQRLVLGPVHNQELRSLFVLVSAGFHMILRVNRDYFLKQHQLIFVMVKCSVFFAVRTESLISLRRSSTSKGHIKMILEDE
jgi:hypothetical protein